MPDKTRLETESPKEKEEAVGFPETKEGYTESPAEIKETKDPSEEEHEGVPEKTLGSSDPPETEKEKEEGKKEEKEKLPEDAGAVKGSETKKTGKKKRKKAPPPKKRRKRTLKQRFIALLIKIGVIAAAVWILVTYVGGVFICHTSDMFPALRDGDLVITYRLGEYHSGDVVVYQYGDKIFYGRIVGEPGDEIYMDESGTFTVNGLAPYETIYYTTKVRDSDNMTFPYTVRQGEYFVLSDAREQGLDSRNFGPVTDLKGRAVLQIRRRGF